jgi:hypothetical protein
MNINIATPAGRKRGKALSLVLSILLVATLFTAIPPGEAYATSGHDTIDVSDTSHSYTDADEWLYSEGDHQFQIEDETPDTLYYPINIIGTSATERIKFLDRQSVWSGVNPFSATLTGLNLTSPASPAFDIEGDWNADLTLVGKSMIVSSATDGTALKIDSDSHVTIAGEGVLALVGEGSGYGLDGDLELDGNVIVEASKVNGSPTLTKGIFINLDAKTMTIGGDVTLPDDFVIPANYTLTVGSGATLTIPKGKTLTIEDGGTLIIDGGEVAVVTKD